MLFVAQSWPERHFYWHEIVSGLLLDLEFLSLACLHAGHQYQEAVVQSVDWASWRCPFEEHVIRVRLKLGVRPLSWPCWRSLLSEHCNTTNLMSIVWTWNDSICCKWRRGWWAPYLKTGSVESNYPEENRINDVRFVDVLRQFWLRVFWVSDKGGGKEVLFPRQNAYCEVTNGLKGV